MPRMRFAVFAILLGFCGTAGIASADDAANAWAALRAGGHVALMRHADAPGGFGDPPGFRVDDCATQRNLSARGGPMRKRSARASNRKALRSRKYSARHGAAASTRRHC